MFRRPLRPKALELAGSLTRHPVWLTPGEKQRVELTIDPASSNHPLFIWNSVADDGRR
ncbi:hypothetical protein [Micromonospora sp. NPDC003776]